MITSGASRNTCCVSIVLLLIVSTAHRDADYRVKRASHHARLAITKNAANGTSYIDTSARRLISKRAQGTSQEDGCPGGGDGWKCDGSSNGDKDTKHGKLCQVECLKKGQKPDDKEVKCNDGKYDKEPKCSGAFSACKLQAMAA